MKTLLHQQSALARAKTMISKRGKRITNKRHKLLAILIEAEKPLSAYELTDSFNSAFDEQIIANSVYRILKWLIDANLAHRLNAINKFIACQKEKCRQQTAFSIFIICKKCQKTVESHASDSLQHEIYQRISRTMYTNVLPHIELTGLCEQCRNDQYSVVNDHA